MPPFKIKPVKSIRAELRLPADKSIAHRSIFLSSIACGRTYIYDFPESRDCLATLSAFRSLGVRMSQLSRSPMGINLRVEGVGLKGLKQPARPINAGESGTTFRLLLGLLSAQRFKATLTAGASLSRRPMRRLTDPLRRMGAQIYAHALRCSDGRIEEYPPIKIKPASLQGISYKMPVASAQVKSALLLAGLYARGTTKIFQPQKTRDHTERMLKDFGADLIIKDRTISISADKELISPGEIHIPGDISSASFFIAAAILLPRSRVLIRSVGLNPGRIGLIRVLQQMGADIRISLQKASLFGSEPVGDILVKSSRLQAVKISACRVPQLIDEIPILMLICCFAKGRSIIFGAEELRFKETDRITSMLTNLEKMGASIGISTSLSRGGRVSEKIIIEGRQGIRGAELNCFGDHRTAMAMIIAGLLGKGETQLDDADCIAKSFPEFLNLLKSALIN